MFGSITYSWSHGWAPSYRSHGQQQDRFIGLTLMEALVATWVSLDRGPLHMPLELSDRKQTLHNERLKGACPGLPQMCYSPDVNGSFRESCHIGAAELPGGWITENSGIVELEYCKARAKLSWALAFSLLAVPSVSELPFL